MPKDETQPNPPRSRHQGSNRRVEVSISHDSDGERQLLVEEMSFGNGVGWYVEKSIRLDAHQIETLARTLGARQKPSSPISGRRRRPSASGEATILRFPSDSCGR